MNLQKNLRNPINVIPTINFTVYFIVKSKNILAIKNLSTKCLIFLSGGGDSGDFYGLTKSYTISLDIQTCYINYIIMQLYYIKNKF